MANGILPLINVDNVDKSLEFYKALGLKTQKITMGPMTMGNVTSGDAALMLFPKHELAPDQPADTRAWVSGELGKGVVLQIGVPNVTKTYQKAKAFGATIDEDVRDVDWGGKMFMVVDPDGYEIAFIDKMPKAPKTSARRTTVTKGRAVKGKAKGKGKKGK